MRTNVCTIKLPGKNNYAIVTPGKITYGLGATFTELRELIQEATDSPRVVDLSFDTLSSRISLIPTFDCTLRCKYCYSLGGESSDTMTLDLVVPALRSRRRKTTRLQLFLVGGGEPLMPFLLVKDIVTEANSIFDQVSTSVVTNGTFNDDVLQWLIYNQVSVRLSFDGVMQKYQRPFPDGSDSYYLVLSNLINLVASGLSLVVQVVISKDGLNTMRQTTDLLVSNGINAVKFEPVLSTDVSRATKDMEPTPQDYAHALLDVISYVADQGYNLTIDTGYLSEPSTGYYCGMPMGNRVLTPSGLITPCVEIARPTDPYIERFKVGEVSDHVLRTNEENINFLQTLRYNNQQGGCGNCNLRLLCLGGCPMANIWREGLPLRKSEYTCKVEHALLPSLLLMIAENEKVSQIVTEGTTIQRFD